jgi:hypothetical protein
MREREEKKNVEEPQQKKNIWEKICIIFNISFQTPPLINYIFDVLSLKFIMKKKIIHNETRRNRHLLTYSTERQHKGLHIGK